MTHSWKRLACFMALLALTSSQKQTRWSRQVSSYTADVSDWVPLTGAAQHDPPIKRQAVAEPRILAEPLPGLPRASDFVQESFPSRAYFQSVPNSQLYLQSVPAVPSAPQNYLTDQGFGQSIRFGLSQPNFGLSQGFVAQQFPFDNSRSRPNNPASNQVKFDNYPKQNIQLPSPQAKPFINQLSKSKTEPKFIDGYRLENGTNNFSHSAKKKPQSLQKIKFHENVEKVPLIPLPQATRFDSTNKKPMDKEEVQLLYVPVESLNKGQFNFRGPQITPQLVGVDSYTQELSKTNPSQKAQKTFASDFHRPLPQSVESFHFGQDYISNFGQYQELQNQPKFSTISSPFPTSLPTTPKPKKLKPHQPPLAVFLTKDTSRSNPIKVSDVLNTLKNAKTVAVLDTVSNINAPEVFIGPFSLAPPENFVKFELPYLSNIENSEKTLRQMPFFVAPLSYNTPEGFAKIPFPSPHVGSVVINSQIKETATVKPTDLPNKYSTSHVYNQERTTTRPNIVYYSTQPASNSPPSYQSNYYSIEPQTVTAVTPKNEPASHFITNPSTNSNFFSGDFQNSYNQQFVKFPSPSEYNTQEPVSTYTQSRKTDLTTTRTTKTTTPLPSTFASPLLETHNPYSINHAFHFSTPVDYHNFFEEYKESYGNPGYKKPAEEAPPTSSLTPEPKPEVGTEKQYTQQPTSTFVHNYSPEVHYNTEAPQSRKPIYNSNRYTTKSDQKQKTIHNEAHPTNPVSSENFRQTNVHADQNIQVEQNNYAQPENHPTYVHGEKYFEQNVKESPVSTYNNNIQPTNPTYYNSYETNSNENRESTISTTTKRIPTKARGRPRYTTTPKTESGESTTKPLVTRKAIRERKPTSPRTRPTYELNKVTTERFTKVADSYEITTNPSRTRTRGRVQFKPASAEQLYEKPIKEGSSKENDLAYQRDVLHQNYPVTVTEKVTEVEFLTEPLPRISSTKETIINNHADTENAYTNEKIAVTEHEDKNESKDDIYVKKFKTESVTEHTYAPRQTTYFTDYQPRSSLAPVEAGISSFGESSPGVENFSFSKETTEPQEIHPDFISFATEPPITTTEQTVQNNSKEKTSAELTTTEPVFETTKHFKQETTQPDISYEEQTVHTTPSYNRVRVRPGVIRQYHQTSSTESSNTKTDRKKQIHAVTYRPAFDKRRTTMRIEEIEADLKTKQVRGRPEHQEYRQPVYKPEPTTTTTTTSASIEETTTKRNNFRRRRPTHSTSSTEASTTKIAQEHRVRHRTRRPIERTTTQKPHNETYSTSPTRSIIYSKYTRPRISERFNKKNEDVSEDQDSNYSLKNPQFVSPEHQQWSTKITESDSFKPYNPNEISNGDKTDVTEQRASSEAPEIITARNENENILISVTPATTKVNNKIPEIPPTLEALIEQGKTTKSDREMTTFENMLEEVMKSLEEQDKDEYTNKTKVTKHKGGEIGEIPPETIVTSEETTLKTTTQGQRHEETTTLQTTIAAASEISKPKVEHKEKHKGRRRGFWKKVKVHPTNTETIEVAESQSYRTALNNLGQPTKMASHDKTNKFDKTKLSVTTYKPSLDFLKDILEAAESEESLEFQPLPVDIHKIKTKSTPETLPTTVITHETTESTTQKFNPGDLDLGTGSPDPTIIDSYTTQTEASTSQKTTISRSDGFSLMDYLFGVSSSDEDAKAELTKATETKEVAITTEQIKSITESTDTYVPEEITTSITNFEPVTEVISINKLNITEVTNASTQITNNINFETSKNPEHIENTSVSSYMDPARVISTSMSTEVSHETEICFRGKCFKSKDLQL